MLTVVHDTEGSNENAAGASLLDEIVRDGARAMLAAALQAAIAVYVEGHRGEVDEPAIGWWCATVTTRRGR